ncbi:MAG: hypothetical protein FD131_4771 [Rhodocyclaceae bacterium]|nr:MAG: hypothetical protein FD131_4771 [Rhodocyclaceae bacterium]
MSQAAQESSIVCSVNESRFLEHMRTLFSTSTTVLAECLQNGRRAGASQIDFDYDVSTSTLTITDNGCGIADFRTLITVAESGWSEEVIASDKPFGIGFFSVSFAAETIVVESRGKKIEFSSEDLIAKRQIAVQTSSFIGGTRISLIKCKLDAVKVGNALGNYAKGFATPVFWQGEELPRSHAQASLVGAMTPVGFIHIPGIHSDTKPLFEGQGRAYCQGLPVSVVGFTAQHGSEFRPIVHVDHQVYSPRMPDRDTLIDSEQASKDFHKVIVGLWRDHLVAKKNEMSAVEFVETFWSVASKAGCLDLMCDVPVLPREVVYHVAETPVQLRDGDSYMYQNKEHVTLEQVQSGEVLLCSDFDVDGEGDEFAKLMFAMEAGLRFVSYGLPKAHWAQAFLRDLSQEEVKVSGRVIAKGDYNGGFASGTVKLIECLSVSMGGVTKQLSEPVALGSDVWGSSMTYLVPKTCSSAGYVLRQASTYTDENDNYCGTDFDLDSDRFDDLVAILAGEPATETVEKCLRSAGARNKTNLRNNAFLVSFDDDGIMTVTEA